MGNKIIASKWLVFGLILPAYSLAQDTHKPLMGLSVKPEEPTYIDRSLQLTTNWESNRPLPGAAKLFTSPARIHLDLKPVSNTRAPRQIPFAVLYRLPRSRPFTTGNSFRYRYRHSNQPATHGAPINDAAVLIRPASME
jgi:hypothetical protein